MFWHKEKRNNQRKVRYFDKKRTRDEKCERAKKKDRPKNEEEKARCGLL